LEHRAQIHDIFTSFGDKRHISFLIPPFLFFPNVQYHNNLKVLCWFQLTLSNSGKGRSGMVEVSTLKWMGPPEHGKAKALL
jgi:hypothetical protein